jgi:deoxycytidylate deaminase
MTTKRRYQIKATTLDKRGRIIAVGYNSYTKTHPLQAEYAAQTNQHFKTMLHAEIAAIIKSKRHDIHSIKIERYDRDGKPRNAQPCAVCQHAIKLAGIRWVNYTVG